MVSALFSIIILVRIHENVKIPCISALPLISVGYRVKSLRGTQFRIWAMGILKEYMKKGFALYDTLSPVEKDFIKSIDRLEHITVDSK